MPFNGPVRVYFDAASAGALTAANNGLAVSGGNTVQWGGDLIQNTVINGKAFDWSFTADDGGNDRNALAWDQSASQFSFGEAANNFAVTGTWYLSPTSQAGYLTFTTYDSPDTAIQIGVDANNYSQLRLYNGSAVLGFDAGRTGANSWGLTIGDAVNQVGTLTVHGHALGNTAFQTFNAGTITALQLCSGVISLGGTASINCLGSTPQIAVAAGTVGAAGASYAGMNEKGLFADVNSTPAQTANTIIYSAKDLTAGNTMPSIYTEGAGALGTGSATNSHTLAIDINGTTYYILLASTR